MDSERGDDYIAAHKQLDKWADPAWAVYGYAGILATGAIAAEAYISYIWAPGAIAAAEAEATKRANNQIMAKYNGPKPSPNFKTPTNPPQLPPTNAPPGYNLRIMKPTQQYPNGYWVLEKPMPQGGFQKVDPFTFKTGPQWDTHVPLPPNFFTP